LLELFFRQVETFERLISDSPIVIREALLAHLEETFIQTILTEALQQDSEKGAMTATIYVTEMLKVITNPLFQDSLFKFFLADPLIYRAERRQEKAKGTLGNENATKVRANSAELLTTSKIKDLLISRISSASVQLSLATLQLFDALLGTFSEHVYWVLLLKNFQERRTAGKGGPLEIWEYEEPVEYILSLMRLLDPRSNKIEKMTKDSGSELTKESSLDLGQDHDDYLFEAQEHHNDFIIASSQWKRNVQGLIETRSEVVDNESGDSEDEFYEGSFLEGILNEFKGLLQQPFDKVLVLTSILSKLIHISNPKLHRFLLSLNYLNTANPSPFLMNLTSLIKDASRNLENVSSKPNPETSFELINSNGMEESELGNDLSTKVYLALSEFCKEISAIILVKSQVVSLNYGNLSEGDIDPAAYLNYAEDENWDERAFE